MNVYLDQVYAKLLDCHKQLSSDFNLVTAKAIKAGFNGHDERHKTLLDLVTYHNENMLGVLKMGTLKNYYTNENYLKRFLQSMGFYRIFKRKVFVESCTITKILN